MEHTIRLTVGQAVALFLQNQWTERDGMERRLIPKACGIYGHGNLSGLGQPPRALSNAARVVQLLKDARKPVIISGGGVYYCEAEAERRSFAETFGIPVVETIAGRSTMGDALPMTVGGMGVAGNFAANNLAEQADLVLAIGTRMLDVSTCAQTAFLNPDVRFASINVLGKDAFKFAAEPILADAREGLSKLAASR